MNISLLDRATEEKLVTLRDVTWEQFKCIKAQLKDNRSVRLSYLLGILEIMSPIGPLHEYVKRTLGYLLEAYMKFLGMRFYGKGALPWKNPVMLLGHLTNLIALALTKNKH